MTVLSIILYITTIANFGILFFFWVQKTKQKSSSENSKFFDLKGSGFCHINAVDYILNQHYLQFKYGVGRQPKLEL